MTAALATGGGTAGTALPTVASGAVRYIDGSVLLVGSRRRPAAEWTAVRQAGVVERLPASGYPHALERLHT